jgi:hypothetical protein
MRGAFIIREQKISRREKALETTLEYHLKNEKLKEKSIRSEVEMYYLRLIVEQNNKKDQLQIITHLLPVLLSLLSLH